MIFSKNIMSEATTSLSLHHRTWVMALLILTSPLTPRGSNTGPKLIEMSRSDTSGWAHDTAIHGQEILVSDRQGGIVIFDRDLHQRYQIDQAAQEVISLSPAAERLLLAARIEGCVLASLKGQVLDRLCLGDIANAVRFRDHLAFAAYGSKGLVIAAIVQDRFKLLAQLSTSGWSHDVQLWSRYALLAAWDGGLQVINISDPTQPRKIAQVTTPGTSIALAMAVAQRRMLVAAAEGHGGVAIFDLENPEQPRLVNRQLLGLNPKDHPHPSAGGWAHGIAWSGNYLFVANWKRGLAILDVSQPESPRMVLESPTVGTALAVAAEPCPDGSFMIILAEGEAGVRALRFFPY